MGITIDQADNGLPVSVIVPLSKKRKDFFYGFVLPLLEANEPKEIIINDNDGYAPKKRNDGFTQSTQPYVFFCDDDVLLPNNYLQILYNKIENTDDDIGFVYTGYQGIVLDTKNHPIKQNFEIKTQEYSWEKLQKGNYISTMSLMKRNIFPMFNTKLRRFQDWDMYLRLGHKGIKGKHVDNIIFFTYYLDEGITTSKNNINKSYNEIKKIHNL